MKRVEIIIGSPRKNGNTMALSKRFSDILDSSRFSISTTFLPDLVIKPCNDCRRCKKDEMNCMVNDDMQKIYNKLNLSDIIIIGTPIYWYGPTAYTKILIDRLRPYFMNKKLFGKSAALLLPAGDGEADCDLTIEMFKRIFKTLNIFYLGAIPAKAYDIGDLNDECYSKESLNSIIRLIST